jgi:hypothetical protein
MIGISQPDFLAWQKSCNAADATLARRNMIDNAERHAFLQATLSKPKHEAAQRWN